MEVTQDERSSLTRNLKSFDYFSENRLQYLYSLVDNSSYAKKLSSLGKEFNKFVREQFYVDILQTTPYHVQMFLIFKDKKGKTKVHDIHCGYLGKMSDV